MGISRVPVLLQVFLGSFCFKTEPYNLLERDETSILVFACPVLCFEASLERDETSLPPPSLESTMGVFLLQTPLSEATNSLAQFWALRGQDSSAPLFSILGFAGAGQLRSSY